MRPVDKGNAPRQYSHYREARNDLAGRIGWYCSYCEMPVKNMIEVEHVIPCANGGEELEWDNFLLSCKYCNTVKSDRNTSRDGYFWADNDNTFLAFIYQPAIIKPNGQITPLQIAIAKNTIDLMGLDRYPGSANKPTYADTRWKSRDQAWELANESLQDWNSVPSQEMCRQIGRTAFGTGHFSIWMEVFKRVPEIKKELINSFTGTSMNCFDADGNPIPRPNGNL